MNAANQNAKSLATVRAAVQAARTLAVAETVDLSGRVNAADLRDAHIAPAFENVWVNGYYSKGNGAVIGCTDKALYLRELARCVADLKQIGFKVRKLPGLYMQYVVQ